ncbi:MAG: copper chaperone PCu(A)C [Brevundimonas sp.]
MNRPLIPAVLLALAACGPADAPDVPAAVATADALCRPTPKGRAMTACYLTLTASVDDRLVAVASPVAGEGQVHEMKIADGMMSMAELENGLALPAGEPVALQPGGVHIMLLALKQPLVAGEQVSLTLTFEKAPAMGVRATVGQPVASGQGAAPG